MFKEIKLIEKYGSGFSRIIKAFAEYKLPIPVFENFQSGFRIVVFTGENVIGTENGELNGELNTKQQLIMQTISSKPGINAIELADKLEIPFSTIDNRFVN